MPFAWPRAALKSVLVLSATLVRSVLLGSISLSTPRYVYAGGIAHAAMTPGRITYTAMQHRLGLRFEHIRLAVVQCSKERFHGQGQRGPDRCPQGKRANAYSGVREASA